MADYSRRDFIRAAGLAAVGGALGGGRLFAGDGGGFGGVKSCGPGSRFVPRVMAAAVRRQEEYGMFWPGAIYDGERALADYSRQAKAAADRLGIDLELREAPLYSIEEAREWVAGAEREKVDGLLVLVLDRQQHSWPTVYAAADSSIPTVAFSPLGTAFTTNTWRLADKKGVFVACTDDFSQAEWGLKMVSALARMREMRYLVVKGGERRDDVLRHFGTKLRYIPKQEFVDWYRKTPADDEIRRMARDYMAGATTVHGSTERDVVAGIRSFVVARRMLEREEGDGITMDCLGALGREEISLPCISWSRMNDCGVPAACEADLEACATQAMVQYLFDRPGFQQDPVPETKHNLLIGSHCSCPTKLHGFDRPAEPYYISHHHGARDAVPRTTWNIGERATVADLLLTGDKPPRMVISAGTVVENIAVPPAGGCVVAVSLELDGEPEVLGYPGFHQLFFYGDFKRELADFCKLAGVEPVVV